MSQVLDVLFELDPTGAEAALLCAATGVLLSALLAFGFFMVHQPELEGRRAGPRLAELDVVALWRLKRSIMRSPAPHPTSASAGRAESDADWGGGTLVAGDPRRVQLMRDPQPGLEGGEAGRVADGTRSVGRWSA